jgi:sugar/nucleoside kinase (ribokinase family)
VTPRVVALGVVILDTLGSPCADLPPGQLGQRVDEIRLTAAGTAAGFAVDAAKLGADVTLLGCIGEDDVGAFLVSLLERHGVDATRLTATTAAQTSASMLPIRPSGERPAYHVVGANAHFRLDVDVLEECLTGASHLHVGGPDSMGGFVADGLVDALATGRRLGVRTSLDLLSARLDGLRDGLRAALPHVDYLMPNDQQICELYETSDVDDACDRALADGAGAVVVTLGGDGCVVVTADGRQRVPAPPVDVVDTTGCGDAFSAGFVRGTLLGWPDHEAARLGCAAGSLVATGLGSDAGIVDLDSTVAAMPAPTAVGLSGVDPLA